MVKEITKSCNKRFSLSDIAPVEKLAVNRSANRKIKRDYDNVRVRLCEVLHLPAANVRNYIENIY